MYGVLKVNFRIGCSNALFRQLEITQEFPATIGFRFRILVVISAIFAVDRMGVGDQVLAQFYLRMNLPLTYEHMTLDPQQIGCSMSMVDRPNTVSHTGVTQGHQYLDVVTHVCLENCRLL